MTMLVLRLSLIVAILAGIPAANARTFQTSDATNIVKVSKPQLNPAGSLASIIVSKTDIENNRFTSELRIVTTDSGRETVALDPSWEVSESRWAPDGRKLAILAKHGKGKDLPAQIYVLDVASQVPLQITQASERVVQLAWSPDGQRIAYGQETALNLPVVDGRLVAFEVKERGYLASEPRKSVQLWIARSDGTDNRQLTKGDWTLQIPYKGSGPVMFPFSWFPDSNRLVIATQAEPDVNSVERDLRTVDAMTGEVRLLLSSSARAINPVVSPDGRKVAYWEYPKPGNAFSFAVRIVDVGTGKVRDDAPASLDRNLNLALWLPNGEDLLVGGNDTERTALWIQRNAAPPVKLPTGNLDLSIHFRVAADISAKGAIAFVASSPEQPAELYFMTGPKARPRQLTDYNSAVRKIDLGKSSIIRWRTDDGFEANGVMTVPPGFKPGHRYPLVIVSHGGPMQASTMKWNSFTQQLAARDWIVFEPNYRGSDNLGRKYQAAIVGDMGAGPGRDIMAGLDALKRQAHVDDARIAVTGESYGGYVSAWLIGHYPGWRAAVLGAALLDTSDFSDLSDVGEIAGDRFAGASPWEPGGKEIHERQSPISSFVGVKTPTLLLTTISDHRVPSVSTQRMFRALRENKVETRFFAYPVDGHGTSDPVRELDWNQRWFDWLALHFEQEIGAAGND